jgi:hypothetical protein
VVALESTTLLTQSAAAAVCLPAHSVSARVWRVKALARWQHWSTPPAANADEAAWREPYRERHTADYEVLRLLADACWPHKQPATFQAIMERGADALDVLSAAARSRSASSMFIGTALHATCALMYLQAHLCGQQLQQLLASQVEPGSTSSSSDAQQPEPPPRDTAASSEREGAAAASGQDAMLEVALLLVGVGVGVGAYTSAHWQPAFEQGSSNAVLSHPLRASCIS